MIYCILADVSSNEWQCLNTTWGVPVFPYILISNALAFVTRRLVG